jgi:diguanylate cyclase (GGDEF)-like protein
MVNSKTSSIKHYSMKYSLVIFMVIFFVAVLHYLAYSQYLKGVQENEYNKFLVHTSDGISRSINFYQSYVDQVAAQPVVADLLEFGTKEEIQAWANKMQRLVPDSIGLTLFDAHGQVKGLEGRLRLSERCLEDVDKRFKNIPIAKPPVHSKIEEIAHFDIVSPVMPGGENIGLVFISFSLDVIKPMITGSNDTDQSVRIVAADGFEISATGNLKNKEGDEYTVNRLIDNTDWEIELTVVDIEKSILLTSLLFSNLIAFVLLSLTLYFSLKKLLGLVITDFEVLSWIMNSIKAGTYNAKNTKHVSLNETKHIMHFIQHTAEELYAYQEKLKHDGMTDELTGLYNRRVLNVEIDNFLKMANEGRKAYLAIIDLDYFKEINDTHGHDVGDNVLKVLSAGLIEASESTDICTRSGGDEFVVLLMDYDVHQVEQWYESLIDYMNKNINSYSAENNIKINFGISVGCTLIRNNDMKSTVLKRADEAMYKVKENGRGNIEFL